jgi:hypothetical protein
VRPDHYDLRIVTDMTGFTFQGTAMIDITVLSLSLLALSSSAGWRPIHCQVLCAGREEGDRPNSHACS